jgi:hypothetical protein
MDESLINTTTAGDQEQPGVAGLRGIQCKGPIGQAIQVNTLKGGQRFSLSAAAVLGPGPETAFFAWGDDSKAGPDKTGRAIEGRPLPIPAAGF